MSTIHIEYYISVVQTPAFDVAHLMVIRLQWSGCTCRCLNMSALHHWVQLSMWAEMPADWLLYINPLYVGSSLPVSYTVYVQYMLRNQNQYGLCALTASSTWNKRLLSLLIVKPILNELVFVSNSSKYPCMISLSGYYFILYFSYCCVFLTRSLLRNNSVSMRLLSG